MIIHNIVEKKDYIGLYTKKLNYPINSENHKYMREKQALCKGASKINDNENWMDNILKTYCTNTFNRQTIWGFRLYDFWCHKLGCAIEVDGKEHDKVYDRHRDVYNYLRSGIVILRVNNMDFEGAIEAIKFSNTLDNWQDRKDRLLIKPNTDIIKLTDPYWNDCKIQLLAKFS